MIDVVFNLSLSNIKRNRLGKNFDVLGVFCRSSKQRRSLNGGGREIFVGVDSFKV
jgi:hypothetical protein